MSDNNQLKIIVLDNAYRHKGKADLKFTIGAVLSKLPEWRGKQAELSKELSSIINEINKLSIEEQEAELEKLAPELLEKKEKEDRNIFSFLKIKDGEKVVACFPPGPEKYPHIGHAKALLINYLLAKQYYGKFILRFEDTNPKIVRQEFYGIMLEDFEWLGVKPDQVVYASDYIGMLKDLAEKLIKSNQAYICFCDQDKMSELREKMEACDCRHNTPEQNLIYWNEMEGYQEGKASLRLKIDMKHKNTRMRDPSIFRVIDAEHPRIGYQHRNYPTYDFQNAVLDGYLGITHRLRTSEFEMAAELHHYIRKILKLYDTFTYEFARFNLEGVLSSGRIIREKIANGELIGWDDPSLPTLRALKRRGFTPEAIKQLVIETGLNKSSGAVLTWDTLIKYNKRVLNDTAKRFFFIVDPVKIEVTSDPKKKYELEVHPKLDFGKRKFVSNGVYYLEKSDVESFKEGQLVRLMDNINFIWKERRAKFKSEDYLDYKDHKGEKAIIHFLPKDDSQLVSATIFKPDHSLVKGVAEKNIEQLKVGDIIQFERFGFCRLDSIEGEGKSKVYNFWFTH